MSQARSSGWSPLESSSSCSASAWPPDLGSRRPRCRSVALDLAYESKFQWLARFGFVARGLLYITIALLVIGTGRTEDLTGAMEYLERGVGRSLLVVVCAGMIGYGLWRVSDAA